MDTVQAAKKGRPVAVDVAELARLYFDRDMSLSAISRQTGIPRPTVAYHMRKDPRFSAECRRRGHEGFTGAGGKVGGRYGVTGHFGRTNVA
jgi:hypothetical protein